LNKQVGNDGKATEYQQDILLAFEFLADFVTRSKKAGKRLIEQQLHVLQTQSLTEPDGEVLNQDAKFIGFLNDMKVKGPIAMRMMEEIALYVRPFATDTNKWDKYPTNRK
jgi:hypothetical protein